MSDNLISSSQLTGQTACSLDIHNRQACFLLRQKHISMAFPANRNHMQGRDVLTEFFDCQQQRFQAVCKSAANKKAYNSHGRYSASCSHCKLWCSQFCCCVSCTVLTIPAGSALNSSCSCLQVPCPSCYIFKLCKPFQYMRCILICAVQAFTLTSVVQHTCTASQQQMSQAKEMKELHWHQISAC